MIHTPNLEASIDRWTEQLLVDGYCVIPDLLPAENVAALDAELAATISRRRPSARAASTGSGRRGSAASSPAPGARRPSSSTSSCSASSSGCSRLGATRSSSTSPRRSPSIPERSPRCRTATRTCGAGEIGEVEYLVNVMWPFTPYTRENGATRVWPESHGHHALLPVPEASELVPEYGPGSALLMLGSTLHAAGENRSREVRRGMIVGYSLGWLKTYENQFLAYPPEIARTFPPELASLVGYRQHRPNLGNYEGRCPSVLLRDQTEGRLGAIDALRPDQKLAVDEHADQQRGRLAA
jgi:hypothetical protein